MLCISAHKRRVDSSTEIAARTRHLFATGTFRGWSSKQISEDFGRRQQGSPEFRLKQLDDWFSELG